jgi:predicted nuclease of restriction endonuclease-like (RecB) superfamily
MFKITWDKENNGVLLTMRSTDDTLNVPPRPVFFEELDLLGLDKYWNYPKSKAPLLWACDRRYFYRGELVLEAKGGNIYDDPQLVFPGADRHCGLDNITLREDLTAMAAHSELYNRITELIEQSRQRIAQSVNLTMVYTYFEIGRYIVDDEQKGEQRAAYGKAVLKELSERLTERFGTGFSERNLEQMRIFYQIYSKQISQTLSAKLQTADNQNNIANYETSSHKSQISSTVLRKLQFTLSWSHYLILMRVENPDARRFYEIEATQQQWSVRQLARQCASSLYERLALSRDKTEVMRLANEGQTIEKPTDILKNPFTLEFLGLEEKSVYTETVLKTAFCQTCRNFCSKWARDFYLKHDKNAFRLMKTVFTLIWCCIIACCSAMC